MPDFCKIPKARMYDTDEQPNERLDSVGLSKHDAMKDLASLSKVVDALLIKGWA